MIGGVCMKNEAIVKINKMGKVGQIIARIVNIFMVLGMVAVIAAMIFFMVIPKDLVTFQISGMVDLSVNIDSLGQKFTEENKEEILEALGVDEIGFNDVEYGMQDIQVTDDEIFVKTSAENISFQLGDLVFLMAAVAISILMVAIVIYFAQRLCKAFRYCESPFEEKVIKSMQQLAISVIPWALVSAILDSYMTHFFTKGRELSLQLDFGKIVIALIIFALTYVFKYGAVLQQESDETL